MALMGSSEVILGSSFVWVYLWYMDVKRNSLCDIFKVGEPRQPGGSCGSRTTYFFICCAV